MDTVDEALNLLKRQTELENAMKLPGGIRIAEERELHNLRRRLANFPASIEAVLQATHSLKRPVSELTVLDVERWAAPSSAA